MSIVGAAIAGTTQGNHMTDHAPGYPEIDLREKLAHIDQMLADHDRKRQEIKHAPWIIGVSLMTAGAAFFAAGVAFMKLLG
jgi:hypothetical protein